MSQDCPICKKPLETMELELSRRWHFECQNCSICGHALNNEQIESCLTKGIEISHTTCYDTKMEIEIKHKPVIVTQELLDWHNERRLIFDPNNELTTNANQIMAATNFRNSRWIHEMDLDNLYLVMKRLEAVAAEASILLAESKRRDNVKKDRLEKDKTLIKFRDEDLVSEQKKLEVRRNRFTPEEKAVKAMMFIGLNREDAVAEITKQKVKKLMKEHADWSEERAIAELNGESPSVN